MFRCSKGVALTSVLALLFSLCVFSQTAGQKVDSSDHEAVITWSADLQGKNEVPAVRTQASAKAEFKFDFGAQTATFKITAQNLQDVSKIVLRVERAQEGLKGPAIVVLYSLTKDGPFPGTYTKTLAGGLFKEVAEVVSNGEGIVEVLTKAHPHGELIGLVQMHK